MRVSAHFYGMFHYFIYMGSKKKLDPELIDILRAFGGDEAIKIGEELYNLEFEVTDEEIHSKTGLKINQVRKILYILNDIGLTQFKRVKDKKTGWYVYYWLHNFDNFLEKIQNREKSVLRVLKTRYHYEKDHLFFICGGEQKCPGRYLYDQAIELQFRCPKCKEGKLVDMDNSSIKHVLKKHMKSLLDNSTLEF